MRNEREELGILDTTYLVHDICSLRCVAFRCVLGDGVWRSLTETDN